MTHLGRPAVLYGTLIAVMFAAATLAGARLLDAKRGYHDARDRAGRAEALAQLIEAMRSAATPSADARPSAQTLADRLPNALEAAGMPERAMADLRYLPSQRPGYAGPDSTVRLERLQLRLEGVTMEQLARFTHELVTSVPGLYVDELRLTAKPDPAHRDRWTVYPLTLAFPTDESRNQPDPATRR